MMGVSLWLAEVSRLLAFVPLTQNPLKDVDNWEGVTEEGKGENPQLKN